MSGPDALQRQILMTGAAMLDQAGRIDALSRGLTIISLIGLLAIGAATDHPGVVRMALLMLAGLVGLAELYFSIRVRLDAALFRQLAAVAPDSRLDHVRRGPAAAAVVAASQGRATTGGPDRGCPTAAACPGHRAHHAGGPFRRRGVCHRQVRAARREDT